MLKRGESETAGVEVHREQDASAPHFMEAIVGPMQLVRHERIVQQIVATLVLRIREEIEEETRLVPLGRIQARVVQQFGPS